VFRGLFHVKSIAALARVCADVGEVPRSDECHVGIDLALGDLGIGRMARTEVIRGIADAKIWHERSP
jgi:hypothetical protein